MRCRAWLPVTFQLYKHFRSFFSSQMDDLYFFLFIFLLPTFTFFSFFFLLASLAILKGRDFFYFFLKSLKSISHFSLMICFFFYTSINEEVYKKKLKYYKLIIFFCKLIKLSKRSKKFPLESMHCHHYI